MTDEEQDMYIYALRYCLTRLSYAPANCADEITRKIDQFSGRVLQVMIQDIGYYLDPIEEKNEYKHIYNTWTDLANKLQTQLDKWKAEKASKEVDRTKGCKMKCPYCNKTLKAIIFDGMLTCANEKCGKSRDMVGTQKMWEKVASLAKIRNAGKKYTKKPDIQEKRKEYMAQKYATDPEFKEKHAEYVRKYRAENKDKVAEWNRRYRETHRESYNAYMRNYHKQKKIDQAMKP